MSSNIAELPSFGGTDKLTRLAWGTLLVLCGALFLDALDVSMMGVALPSIRTSLNMSTSSLQWVVSAYVLGYGGFLLLGGRAADLLGRRRVFLIALGVFIVASVLGGFADNGTLLIATRFIKGISAAFTAPAALSIITTSFAEGPARNKALSIFTATGATGFSLGLVFGGLLTEIGWRWVFFLPAPVALVTLIAGLRLVPRDAAARPASASFDVSGAVSMTTAMLLLVFTLVEAPTVGWLSARTLASLAGVVALFAAFVARERSAAAPLVRLGILRSGSLVRANLGAMSLFGGWVGFQFIVTLYLQQLRGWSALDTGLAIFPAGVLVAFVSRPPASPCSSAATPLGPLNVAGTSGVAAEEQGLAGGLLNTSFQFGGALVLAIVTAVINANVGSSGTPQAPLDGFHAALFVSVGAAVLGIVAMTRRSRSAEVIPAYDEIEEALAEAAEAA